MRTLLLALVPVLLTASEPLTYEVRLTGGITPGVTGVDLALSSAGGSGSASSDMTAQVGFSVEPQFVLARQITPLIGFTSSLGLFYRQHEGKDPADSTSKITVAAFGVDVSPALALHFDPRFWLEVGPTIAVGSGRRQVRTGGQENPDYPDGSGLYVSYGGRVGGYMLLKEHWVVGVEVGYLAFSSEDTVTGASAITTDSTTKGHGVMANACVGYHF